MSDKLYLATRKGLLHVERGGDGWQVKAINFPGDNHSLVCQDPRDNTLYACQDLGHFGVKLHRSEDDGATWSEVAAPAYPKAESEEEQKDAPAVKMIWAMVPGGADQLGLLWAGTIPGGLFLSEDRGDSWTMVDSLENHPDRKEWFGGGADEPGIHSILVDPDNSDTVVLGVSCGGVWRSTDRGKTWELKADGMRAAYMPPDRAHDPRIQDPHQLAQCPASPDTIWAQHHNGIFVSRDRAESWQEIETAEPSAFGFGVVVHPDNPDKAWFVPAQKDETRIPVSGQVVVSRTEDGGKSFSVLRQGLPQDFAYDLVYRHALDIDGSGERLAFGSTTGNLWVSENGGDDWIHVSAHLPPIYAVRFKKS